MNPMDEEDPWKWMQPYDVCRFGEVILDRKEQERWCRAVLLGGLPFMWRKAEVARNLIYDKLELREGGVRLPRRHARTHRAKGRSPPHRHHR